MKKNDKIYIAGHRGLVGSAILRKLKDNGYENLIYKTHSELDLTDQNAVNFFLKKEKPDFVFLCAARLGGIEAHKQFRAEFIYDNLQIQNNVIHQSYINNVKKLLFISSTSVYPEHTSLPIKEEYLLSGKLQYLHEPYAIAKIAGMKMCEAYSTRYNMNFISVCPTTLYGPNDNFDIESANVVAALMRKIHLAKLLSEKRYDLILKDLGIDDIDKAKNYLDILGVKENSIEIWGSGNPKREFLYSDDLANACIHIMQNINIEDINIIDKYNPHINIGPDGNYSIKELACLLKTIIQFEGGFTYNLNKPDGTYEKLTCCDKIKQMNWQAYTKLEDGLRATFHWYKNNKGLI
ncbi:GDP-L-fucose synthase [Campylobacter sp. CNRCH_2014_2849]|uniref:GDP-L-fucose synthase family protein n=1 Tax=Campylobacter TaxID=194 RepID=UPI0021E6BE97|nr:MULTISPECIES: GDP-L-fucose synthase [Campylobacter]MCV3472884.1 GDP-L-fucose synthase [Campylobacter sp. CNRCH_2014_2849]MCW0185117.1 GDP-L-fucose synthase [Campylobacter lari]